MPTTERAAVHTPSGKPGLDTAQVVLVLGLLATALIYLDTLSFQFVYDDVTLIVRNPQVQSWSNLPHFFTQHLWAAYAATGNYYRPVYQLWLLLNYTAFGLNPLGWHITTVAVHLGATLLVYVLLAKLGAERLTAAIAASLFGVHPVHIESVAWVSGVIDPLTAVFFLGALLCHLQVREGKRWCLGPALALCALALLTKEAAAVLPGVVLVVEWRGLGRRQDDMAALSRTDRLRSAVTWTLPYAAVAVLYLVARHYALVRWCRSSMSSLSRLKVSAACLRIERSQPLVRRTPPTSRKRAVGRFAAILYSFSVSTFSNSGG